MKNRKGSTHDAKGPIPQSMNRLHMPRCIADEQDFERAKSQEPALLNHRRPSIFSAAGLSCGRTFRAAWTVALAVLQSIFRAFTIVLLVSLLTATAKGQGVRTTLPETMTEDSVIDFVTEQEISTVEAFIQALPPLHKRHFVAVRDSESPAADFISTSHPRIVSWGADARFVVTWTTNPEDPGSDKVEFLQPVPAEGRWIAGVIDFSGDSPEIRHPAACAQCHGDLGKPVWGADDVHDGTEDTRALHQAMSTSTHPRLTPLELDAYQKAPRQIEFANRDSQTPNWEFALVLALRHSEVLFNHLRVRQDYDPLSRSVACSSLNSDLQRRVRSEFDPADYNIRLLSDTLEPVQGENPRTLLKAGEYKGGDVILSMTIGFLVFHDLWQRFESVRDLYRGTSNEHALNLLLFSPREFGEDFLRYPIGQATVEDELVAAYREFFELRGQASIDERALRAVNPRYGAGFPGEHATNFRDRVCSALSPADESNRGPEAVTALSGLTLRIGDGAMSIDVAGAFRDPDGDALTYRASSSATSVVSVWVSGSQVTLTPLTAGAATVTAWATDRGGSNTDATQRFRVTVQGNEGVIPPSDPDPDPPPPTPGGGGGGGGGGPRTSAPGAPRNLTAMGGDGQAVLSWDAPASDGGAAITDYEYRINGQNPWISIGSTETTYTVTGLDNGTVYTFEVRAVNRIGKSFAPNQVEATPEAPEVLTLDFAHFANGEGTTSDLVFVNVGSVPVRPALYFYDTEGALVSAESVVDITGDLEISEDGGLTVLTEIEPLGELTILTHGRGDLVSGSVKVASDGPLGGMLRYNLPGIGEAVVGASPPVSDALFAVRRQEGGITTGVAVHNLEEEAMEVVCELMQEGVLRDTVSLPLAANGQSSWLIEGAFPGTDTSDFAGSVQCDAVGEGLFTALALEMDPGTRVFLTLPLFPVNRRAGGRAAALDFAHFANGEGTTSDLVFVNVSTQRSRPAPTPFHTDIPPIRPAIYFYDTEGALVSAESVVDVTGDLAVTEDGALTVLTEMEPLEVLTISTHGQGELVSGSVKVVADGPIGGVLRFDLPYIGVAGVGASPPLGDALFPVRRQEGGITTGVALHNLESSPGLVRCDLMREGVLLDAASFPLEANGQTSWLIDQAFPGTDTSDFAGAVRCDAVGEGLFSAVALEMDPATRIFTTLPVFPVSEMPDRE